MYEVPHEEGNEQSKGYKNEEWPTGYAGNMPQMRHKDVPYRQELGTVESTIDKLGLLLMLSLYVASI